VGDRKTDNLLRFENQIALVVGAAHGIGKAIAVRLGREGADVVIADVDAEVMETTVLEMQGEGSQCKGVICDVRDQAQVEAAVKLVLDWRGRIDILMYIAGIAAAVPFVELACVPCALEWRPRRPRPRRRRSSSGPG